MKSRVLFNKVKKLNLPFGKYAIFGSGPLSIRGLRECHDIDIIVTENIFNEHKNKPEWQTIQNNSGGIGLTSNDIELWKDWGPGEWDIDSLIKNAEIIDSLPFVNLKDTLKWKRLAGRKKDLRDVKLIENYLKIKVEQDL